MAPKCKRVAVLGAGVGGLASVKSCLEEGMEVVAYDSRPCIGGIWSGTKDEWSLAGPSMYSSLISNTSKSLTCFSDFPCPASYPPFLPHYVFQEYLRNYAQNFRLLEHIKFNTRVVKVTRTADHASTGRWRLRLRACPPGTATPQTEGDPGVEVGDKYWEEEFDAVMVATGFYSKSKSPDFPGLKTSFTGAVSHSSSYVDAEPFKGKTVIVVGNASSAVDIAVEVSSVAKQVYLSVGNGLCVTSRMNGAKGLPADHQLSRAMCAVFSPQVAINIFSWMLHKRVNHRNLGLLHTGTAFPLVPNDDLPISIMCGKVKTVGYLKEFKGSEVTTSDGRVLREIDAVIFATGYERDLSVLDESLGLGEERLPLYKQVFPIHEQHHTLALVGCMRVTGPMPPALELQARMAAYTISGRHKLPSAELMKIDSDRYNEMARQPDGSYKYAFLSVMIYEELAAEIGVLPGFWRLVLSGKPRLAFKSLLGPVFPFNYRLIGPGAWKGAESAMDKAVEENKQALVYRTLPEALQLREKLNVPTGIKLLSVLSLCIFLFGLYVII